MIANARRIAQGDYVVKYLGTTSKIPGQYKSIVMEYVKNDLSLLLEKEGLLSQRLKVKSALDIARGIERLHSAGIYHRDIKASNCLVRNIS